MTDAGLIGLGEASDGFGFANTTADDVARMRRELQRFFELINGRSPFEIESYRQRGELMARQGLVPAERFVAGTIEIPDRPGFGVALNQDVIRTRALAV